MWRPGRALRPCRRRHLHSCAVNIQRCATINNGSRRHHRCIFARNTGAEQMQMFGQTHRERYHGVRLWLHRACSATRATEKASGAARVDSFVQERPPTLFVQKAASPIRMVSAIQPSMSDCRHARPTLDAEASQLHQLTSRTNYVMVAGQKPQSSARCASVAAAHPRTMRHNKFPRALVAATLTPAMVDIITAVNLSVPHGQPAEV